MYGYNSRAKMYTPKVYSMDFATNRKYEKKYKVCWRSDWARENDTYPQ